MRDETEDAATERDSTEPAPGPAETVALTNEVATRSFASTEPTGGEDLTRSFVPTEPATGTVRGGDELPSTDATTPWSEAETRKSGRDAFAGGGHARIGVYSLQNRLGAGGQGEVWRAVQLEPIVRVVALKLLSADAALDHDKVARFRKEAERGGKLSGPSILPVYDFGVDGGRAYIAMPLVEGFSLSQVIEQRRAQRDGTPFDDAHKLASLTEPEYQRETCLLLARISRAVAEAHAGRILHRDIKPSNILLDRAGGERVYLSDFGLAHDLDAASTARLGFQPGTPIYMAPERLLGKPEGDGFPAEIFSLGATAYEALSLGRALSVPKGLPFATWPTFLASSEIAPPRRVNPKLSRDAEAVILKALDPNPALRYATASDLADDFERLAKGEPVLARPVGPLRKGLRRLMRRRRLLAAAAAVAIVGLTLLGVRLGLSAYAAKVRGEARARLAQEDYVEAGRLASQAQGLDPGSADGAALYREIAVAMVSEAQVSPDNSNVDQALQWFRAWADLDARLTGDAVSGRAELALELGLLDVEVVSDRDDTVVSLRAVHPDGRPRNKPPLYRMAAYSPIAPGSLPELIDGLYWLTAVAPGGAFVEYLYQPPPDIPTNKVAPLILHPRTNAEATVGMALVKGGRLTRRDIEELDPRLAPSEVEVEDFHLDTAEVTNRQFSAYLDEVRDEETAARVWPGRGRPDPDRLDWPVTRVTYAQAAAYAAHTGCRLPSDDELEWAARGAEGRSVPPGVRAGWRPSGPEWLRLHPVRSLPEDRIPTDPPIFGLYANAGELTLFRYRPTSFDLSRSTRDAGNPYLYRRRSYAHALGAIPVRSGLGPLPNSSEFQLLGYTRIGVTAPEHVEPSVGFRRARSLRPRFDGNPTSSTSPAPHDGGKTP